MTTEPTSGEETRMARTLEAQHREGVTPTISEMADTLIDVYGFASARRIARQARGDGNYWYKVCLTIEALIRDDS